MPDPRHALPISTIQELHRHALVFADAARALITAAWVGEFTVSSKSDGSPVTNVDVAVEEKLRTLIARHYPEHGVLGEELPPTGTDSDFQWILDPIDGTEDFVHRVPTFGSILAVHYRGAPVVGILDHPALGVRCHAAYGCGTYHGDKRVTLTDLPPAFPPQQVRLVSSARGNFIRFRDEGRYFDAVTREFPNHRIYRSCYGHTLAATGAVDAMVDYHDAVWDLAACQITTEEAGGAYRMVRAFAVDGMPIQSVVLGKPSVVARLCALLDAP